jgi:hypothetical protein
MKKGRNYHKIVRTQFSFDTGLPFGDFGWMKRLSKKLDLDLTTRAAGHANFLDQPATENRTDLFCIPF